MPRTKLLNNYNHRIEKHFLTNGQTISLHRMNYIHHIEMMECTEWFFVQGFPHKTATETCFYGLHCGKRRFLSVNISKHIGPLITFPANIHIAHSSLGYPIQWIIVMIWQVLGVLIQWMSIEARQQCTFEIAWKYFVTVIVKTHSKLF